MITQVETGKDGERLRVFHRDDSGEFTWTHPADSKTRGECTACTGGTVPDSVRRSPK